MAPDAQTGNIQPGNAQIACPHCHKPFEAKLLAGGPQRHRGFKCPHCKLFVPESRAEDSPLTRDSAS